KGRDAAALPGGSARRGGASRLLRRVLDGCTRRVQGGSRERAKEEHMSSAQTSVEPVRRTVVVNRSVEDAFRVFTEEIGKWWALEVHSLSLDRTGAPAETAIMEGQVGGRLYERMGDAGPRAGGRPAAW